jgi:acylphosphatase
VQQGEVHVRRRLVISGLVQGVFYRASARRQASVLGVSGFARNLVDGRVEIEVEGPPDTVDAFIAWARRGPAHAVVTDVAITELAPTGGRGFHTD